MKRLLKNNKGFALILTILIVSLIVVLTLDFNISMRSNLYSSANLKDGIKLGCIARSGFNYALAILYEDVLESDFDSLHEDWVYSKAISSNSGAMFEDGRFEVQIKDHSGRIQINQLTKQKGLMTRFLSSEQFGLDPEKVSSLIDAIKDWIDLDNEVTGFGAENEYYQGMEKPYSCKNAPLELLEELLLVKGVIRELFYGTKEKPGISHYLTTHGDGRININTADPLVLWSLSDQIDQEMVEEMLAYREDKKNNLKDPKWYQKVSGMSQITIDPDLVTSSSTHFEIKSEGFKEAMVKLVTGMVERSKDTLRILSWKIE